MVTKGEARRGRRIVRCLAVLGIAVALLAGGVLYGGRGAVASAPPVAAGPLTAAEVIAAFAAAGLAVDDARQQPVGRGGASGPPLTEREAWAFSVPGLAPSGGRILIFDEDEKLNKKAAWFRRAGAEAMIVAHHNVILWLDPALEPREAARYRQALRGLR